MADISTRMSVSGISQYKSAMQQAAQSVKTLDAQLKQADAEFKATGDKEKYMADKAKLLEDKLKAQKTAAKNAQQALKQMQSQGVDPLSQAYQKMQQQLAQAETGVLETSAAINTLGQSEQQAAKGADQLTASVQGISKKISLEQVIGGINKITDGLESAAKKAAELGKTIWNEIVEQAGKADEIATRATMYDMTAEEYQAIAKVAATWGETSVEAIMKARQRVQGQIKNITDDLLGIGVNPYSKNPLKLFGREYGGELKDWEDIFWEAGEALLNMGDAYKKAEKAQAIFGRRWEELVPMFKMGRDLYEQTVASQIVADNESIQKLAELNDTINTMKSDFESLEQEVLAGMAPALTKAASTLDRLLGKLMDYLKTEDGQQMLERMGEAVSGLFEDLANIDPENVVNSFVTVFQQLVDSFTWISNNWSDVETGLKSIVGVWAGGKVISGALTIVQMLNGLRGLTGAGAGGAGEIALSLGGKLAFNGVETTLGTSIGGAIANVLTSTPLTVAIAAASIAAIAHGIYVAMNNKNPIEQMASAAGFSEERTKEIVESIPDTYNPFDTEQTEKVTNLIKNVLTGGKTKPEPVAIPVEPETQENAAEEIAEQIGEVTVPVKLRVVGGSSAFSGGGGGGGLMDYFADYLFGSFRPGFANGLPFVPFDGYPAILHRGERVLTERENRNYTISNNTYFGGVSLHNGLEVDALTDSIAARNAKVAAGYGAN